MLCVCVRVCVCVCVCVCDNRVLHTVYCERVQSMFPCVCVFGLSLPISLSWGLDFSCYALHDIAVMICTLMSIY